MSTTAPAPTVVAPTPGTAARLEYLTARPVVSLAEAGELTGLSRSTLLRAIAAGDLASSKVGRRVMIPTAGLLALVGAS
jgi:excisionase family DNA binding protein